jgi:hypothetical protein
MLYNIYVSFQLSFGFIGFRIIMTVQNIFILYDSLDEESAHIIKQYNVLQQTFGGAISNEDMIPEYGLYFYYYHHHHHHHYYYYYYY